MGEEVDVIIIGAGVIGAATAFELGKRGYRTLNIDKLPSAGYGPTSNSCAIVRAHYSSLDGVAMAYEGFKYWEDWENYLEVPDEMGLAKYMQCGTILLKSSTAHHDKVLPHYDALGVTYEDWDTETTKKRMPIFDMHEFWPPTRPTEDPDFMSPRGGELPGAIFTPESGYVSDPALSSHNLQRAAEAKGGRFLFRTTVTEIRQENGKVTGVTLEDGTQIDAGIVVNVAGPHSFVINRMAGVEDGMNIKTKALRHEVHHVPAPEDFDYDHDGHHVSDGDNAIYFRPEAGNNILIGSEDPDCDPQEWIEDPSSFNRSITKDQWEAQVYRCARRIPSLPIPHEMKGVVDLYDCSDDWIPLYDKSDLPGFYMAIGTSGNQFKNGPIAGHCMAELIDAVEKGHDHDREPLKVTAPYTGATLDMGFYSRLREINENSSFSVNG
jgi:sarcosine oxidase, subunit beta